MSSIISTALIFLLVPLILPLFAKLLKKTGMQELSDAEYKQLSKIKYPNYFAGIYIVMALGILALPIAWMLGGFLYGPMLQESLFGKDALVFSSGPGLFFVILISFFPAIILFGGLTGDIIYLLSPKIMKMYLIYRQAKSGFRFKDMRVLGPMEKFGLGCFIVLLPFFYLALHDYQAIYPTKIVLNTFMNPTDQIYGLDQLAKVTTSSKITSNLNRGRTVYNVTTSFLVHLKNGRQENLGNGDIAKFDPQVYSFLQNHGVIVDIQKPNQTVIDFEYSCYREKQNQLFSQIFQLDSPRYTQVSCSN